MVQSYVLFLRNAIYIQFWQPYGKQYVRWKQCLFKQCLFKPGVMMDCLGAREGARLRFAKAVCTDSMVV